MLNLDEIPAKRCDGTENFRNSTAFLSFTVLEFWQWSGSDLVSNAMRGRIAEFIVAKACGISTDGVRNEWAAFDLKSSDGNGIEVRSAAYLQSWHQKQLSKITFSVRKARPWDATTGTFTAQPSRTARVYVFALLAHQDKKTVNPLDVNQWEFYVLPTATLDARTRSQHSITLPSLIRLNAGPHSFSELGTTVERAATFDA